MCIYNKHILARAVNLGWPIIINNLVDHDLGKLCQTTCGQSWLIEMLLHKPVVDHRNDHGLRIKLCQTMVNHAWLKCHFINLSLMMVDHDGWSRWLTMVLIKLCQSMVNHGWLSHDHGLGKLCQTMVNHGWLRYHFTNLWLTMVSESFANHGWLL